MCLVPFSRTAQVCQLGFQPQRRHLLLISFNFVANLPLISLEKGETKRGLPQISTQKDYATSLGDYAYHSTFHEPFMRFSRLAVPKIGGFD